MNSDTNNLSRAEKILLFLYEFGNGSRQKIRYEDIVAGLFEKYPHDFQLKGYPQYPDSGDLIHKPLYEYKKKGYLVAANKVFSLTDRGVELAEQLANRKGGAGKVPSDRLARSTDTEMSRARALEGFALFSQGKVDKLSDGDFYSYLGVTVRTPKNTFMGRLETMKAVVADLKSRSDDPKANALVAYHDFLVQRYAATIEYFLKQ